jgi:hypothetical protein
MPAKAGIQASAGTSAAASWTPAFAGMTDPADIGSDQRDVLQAICDL